MDFPAGSRSTEPMRHRIEVEFEREDAPEIEAEREHEVQERQTAWQTHLDKVEVLLANVEHLPAPKGLAKRIMERIRQAMQKDLERQPSDAHEAIAQAYTLVMLSTLPVLFSASWALAHATQLEKEQLSALIQQLTEILQLTTADLRALHANKYAAVSSSTRTAEPQLVELTMDLIPLAVMKVIGEALQELQDDFQRIEIMPEETTANG